MAPLVSVLIPTYNRKRVVCEAIDSALAQTYENIEIIVTDNGSADDSFEYLCDRYADNKKVKLYENGVNLGLANNWIKCLEKAEGDYIKILFSDDLIKETFVERCVKVLENNKDCAFVYSDIQYINENGEPIELQTNYVKGTGKKAREEYFIRLLRLEGNGEYVPATPGVALFRKRDVVILNHIDNKVGIRFEDSGAGIDIYIYLNAWKDYPCFYYIDEKLELTRWHLGAETVKNNRDVNAAWKYSIYLWMLSDSKLMEQYAERLFYKDCIESIDYRNLSNRLSKELQIQKEGHEKELQKRKEKYSKELQKQRRIISLREQLDFVSPQKAKEWIICKDIRKVAIYGAGFLGRALKKFLIENTNVEIKYYIDRNEKNQVEDVLVGLDQPWDDVDTVFVTAVVDGKDISDLIKLKMAKARIVFIDEFLADMF